jgi:RNA polymerase sigma-70 factor, ECF subfamily
MRLDPRNESVNHEDQDSPSLDLEKLFRDHADGLGGAVRGVLGAAGEVAEVLQESFLRAWRAHQSGSRPRDPIAWIFVITLNTAKDLRRRARLRATAALEEIDPMQNMQSAEPAARLLFDERLAEAKDAIHRLAEHERSVFLLRVSAGLPYESIALELAIPVGTAKSRMRSALANLQRTMRVSLSTPSTRSDS